MADLDFQPLDFQPEDQQSAAPTAPVQPSGNSGQLDFKPLDFQPDTPADSGVISKTTGGSSLLFSGLVKPEEVKAIADKHGIDADHLKAIAPYFGVNLEPNSLGESAVQGAKATAGELGNTAGLGLPQFAYKHLAMDPKERQALDDLSDLSKSRESLQDKALGVGRMLVTPIASLGAKSALGRIGEAAAVGGIFGATGAREGEELKGAGQGAVLGGAFGLAAEGIGRLLGSGSKLAPDEMKAIRGQQTDLQSGIEQVAKDTRSSEDLIRDIGLGDKGSINPDEAQTIVKEQLGEDTIAKYLDPRSSENKAAKEQLGDTANDQDIINHLADQVVTDRIEGFAKELNRGKASDDLESAMKDIEEYAGRQGQEHTADKYNKYVESLQAQKYVAESGAFAKEKPGFFSQTSDKLSNPHFVYRYYDDKYGTKLLDSNLSLNQATNRYSYARDTSRRDLQDLFNTAKAIGSVDAARDGTLYQALDTGNLTSLSPQEKQLAEAISNKFNKTKDFVNGVSGTGDKNVAPMNIPTYSSGEAGTYIPHMAVPMDELIPRIEGKIQQAKEELSTELSRPITNFSQLTPKEFIELKDKGALGELNQFATWKDSVKDIKGGDLLDRKLNEALYSKEGNDSLESIARSSMERNGQIPDFILEKDIFKLADKYDMNTLKHLYLRNPLDKMQLEAKKLNLIGATPEEMYVKRHIQDMLGIRKGTPAEGIMRVKLSAGMKFDKLIEKVGPNTPSGYILTMAKAAPDLLYAMTRRFIYDNTIGALNLKAATQHVTTGLSRVSPELGGAYGYATVGKAFTSLAVNFSKNVERARLLGNLPAHFTRHGEEALAQGLMTNRAMKLTASGYDALSRAGMILFQKGEEMNRALVIGVADQVANDLLIGSRSAQRTVAQMPRSVQAEVARNTGNQQAISDTLARYINDTTIFNYSKSQMFELGRTLGPMLSTFSKWPTSIYGEAVYDLRSKGVGLGAAKLMERLVVPWIGLNAVHYAIFHHVPVLSDRGDQSDIEKKLTGSGGLPNMAPLGALLEFGKGKTFTPPMIDIGYNNIIKPTLEGDPAKVAHGLDTALRYYAPGSGFIRFLTDDLVTYATGRAPEGDTFVEKTGNGINRIERVVK